MTLWASIRRLPWLSNPELTRKSHLPQLSHPSSKTETWSARGWYGKKTSIAPKYDENNTPNHASPSSGN